jgi:uncharacterized SAM-binding protein YcdF (DUF218 family)
MIVPRENMREVRRRGPLSILLTIVVMAALVWSTWVFVQIRGAGNHDEAQKADAIAVFGAAEYVGKPSPVLRARLDHALDLYNQGFAPIVITLGGATGQGDVEHSEAGVGEHYLQDHGVPESAIIEETLSLSTLESVHRLAALAKQNNLHSIIVVSDASHLFRIREMCKAEGLVVYTSPRSAGPPIGFSEKFSRVAHEILAYTAWRMHLNP